MRYAPRGGPHERHERHRPDPAREDTPQLAVLAKRIRQTARLASMALEGNDPQMGLDYLMDALEMLREALPAPRRPKPRHAV